MTRFKQLLVTACNRGLTAPNHIYNEGLKYSDLVPPKSKLFCPSISNLIVLAFVASFSCFVAVRAVRLAPIRDFYLFGKSISFFALADLKLASYLCCLQAVDACVRDGMRPSSIFGSSINGSINPLGTVTQFQAAMSGNTNGNTIGSNSNGNNVTNDSNIPGFVFKSID